VIVTGIDPSSEVFYWATIEAVGGKITYVDSGKANDPREVDFAVDLVVVEKPGGSLYHKVRYDHLINVSVMAGRVYQEAINHAKVRTVNAHGNGGWRPGLLRSGKGRRGKGQEVAELEILLLALVEGLPKRNGRLKGAMNEHNRDALGIAVWGVLVAPQQGGKL